MDFTFLTIPARIRFSIPSKPSVNISFGVYGSFLTDYSMNYLYSDKPAKNDYGYIYSTGLSYPLIENMDVLLDVGYTTGRRRFLDYAVYKHGSFDFKFGVAFKGFLKKQPDRELSGVKDSINSRYSLTYKGGVNVSWNYFGDHYNSYSIYIGYSAGFSVDYALTDKLFLRTGLFFQNTGYSLKDSSDSFNRYHRGIEPLYDVDTKIGVDYVNIPLQLGIRIRKPGNIYLCAGRYLAIRLNARCTGLALMADRDQDSYYLRKYIVNDDLGGLISKDDFGWLLGAGVSIPVFEKYSIDLGIQYLTGTSDIYNEDFLNMTQPAKGEMLIRNRFLSLQVGFKVPVFK
jgi:opacity protein-like surface antigen